MLINVIGDVMMSAGVVAYLGAFTVSLVNFFSVISFPRPNSMFFFFFEVDVEKLIHFTVANSTDFNVISEPFILI